VIRRLLRRFRDRRGFALPTVILLVALLTVLLTAGLSRARTESQIAYATNETEGAFTIAEGGLQAYLGGITLGTPPSRPPDGDSVRINIPGGYANVVAHLVRHPADTTQRSLYLIRSTGVVVNPDSGARAEATHSVAQFAEWESSYMLHRAALTSANGVERNSGFASTVMITGNGDPCGATPIPGVRAADTVGSFSPTGNPGLIVESGTTIAAQTLINWSGALGDDLVPDYTSFQNGNATYPVQRVLGDANIVGFNPSGTGILLVSGDLHVVALSFQFKGIILVGGKIEFDVGTTLVRGLIVSGLGKQLGAPNPGRTEMGGDFKSVYVYYDSCEIQNALASLSGLAGVRNAWMDTWASY
jgi:hypothetical protein